MGLKAKDLKSLSRGDLLELLLAQTERAEELEKTIAELSERVESKDILIEQSGTLAEASLAVNQVFQAADHAAAQYLGNVMRIYDELVEKNAKLEEEYTRKLATLADEGVNVEELLAQISAEEIRAEIETAQNPADDTDKREAMLQEAAETCDAMLTEAKAQCAALTEETRMKCATLTEETQMKCAAAELESQDRCREMEQATKLACEEMECKAKEAADAYWDETYAKIKRYVASHGELKDLLLAKR